jgi:hypothetical protein
MPAPSGKTTIVGGRSSRLSELGIELPKPPTPLGAYVESSAERCLYKELCTKDP